MSYGKSRNETRQSDATSIKKGKKQTNESLPSRGGREGGGGSIPLRRRNQCRRSHRGTQKSKNIQYNKSPLRCEPIRRLHTEQQNRAAARGKGRRITKKKKKKDQIRGSPRRRNPFLHPLLLSALPSFAVVLVSFQPRLPLYLLPVVFLMPSSAVASSFSLPLPFFFSKKKIKKEKKIYIHILSIKSKYII